MTQLKNTQNKKKQRLKINNIIDFNKALKKEGYKEINTNEDKFKQQIINTFNVDKSVSDIMYDALKQDDITYRADNILDFVEYMKNIKTFKQEEIELTKKINQINKLNIYRIEYEREISTQDNVDHIIIEIEKIKDKISNKITSKELDRLTEIETQLNKDYIYSKDIELLKKMITIDNNKTEKYNDETKTKTVSIDISDIINSEYIPAKLGSIEYHNHIKNNIPRMKRLRKNIRKYMVTNCSDNKIYNINQSITLQDTINIAVATYNNKEYKAISGSNEVPEFVSAPPREDAYFISSKVNKLGKLGIGYNRVNDSEKKILEAIHKQIKAGEVKNHGNLVLYSKWQPCPSCYYVISQFCKTHPNINVQVKYNKEYGE